MSFNRASYLKINYEVLNVIVFHIHNKTFSFYSIPNLANSKNSVTKITNSQAVKYMFLISGFTRQITPASKMGHTDNHCTHPHQPLLTPVTRSSL